MKYLRIFYEARDYNDSYNDSYNDEAHRTATCGGKEPEPMQMHAQENQMEVPDRTRQRLRHNPESKALDAWYEPENCVAAYPDCMLLVPSE